MFPIVFAIIATVVVGAFVAVVPVGFGLDEEHHIYRAWQVSRGQPVPQALVHAQQYGGPIPTALVDYVIEGTDAANAARGYGMPWNRRDIALAPDLERYGAARLPPGSTVQPEEFTNASAASFVAYMPAALGMKRPGSDGDSRYLIPTS